MKRILSALLMVALIATMAIGFAACGTEPASSSSTGLKTVVAGELHMATNAAFPPYEMLADDGISYEGIDVEIATEIAKMLDEQESEGKPRELTAVCRFCNSEYTFDEKTLMK